MQKIILISFFISAILVKPVYQFSWELWYVVNIEYATEELCENQDQPELECNGKCYLMQQMAKAEVESTDTNTTEKPVQPFKVKEEQPVDTYQKCCKIDFISDSENKRIILSRVDNPHPGIISDIFHPPQV